MCQRAGASGFARSASSAAGSFGTTLTSKRSSGTESPSPSALTYASFRVQQRKNARVCDSGGTAASARRSAGVTAAGRG